MVLIYFIARSLKKKPYGGAGSNGYVINATIVRVVTVTTNATVAITVHREAINDNKTTAVAHRHSVPPVVHAHLMPRFPLRLKVAAMASCNRTCHSQPFPLVTHYTEA